MVIFLQWCRCKNTPKGGSASLANLKIAHPSVLAQRFCEGKDETPVPQRLTQHSGIVNRWDNAEVNYENQPSEKDLHTDSDHRWRMYKQQSAKLKRMLNIAKENPKPQTKCCAFCCFDSLAKRQFVAKGRPAG